MSSHSNTVAFGFSDLNGVYSTVFLGFAHKVVAVNTVTSAMVKMRGTKPAFPFL